MPSKDEIKNWMTRANMSRQQLADALDVSINTLNKWLSSPREITPRRMAAIERLMNESDTASTLQSVRAFSVRFTAAEWQQIQAAHGVASADDVEVLLRRLALQG